MPEFTAPVVIRSLPYGRGLVEIVVGIPTGSSDEDGEVLTDVVVFPEETGCPRRPAGSGYQVVLSDERHTTLDLTDEDGIAAYWIGRWSDEIIRGYEEAAWAAEEAAVAARTDLARVRGAELSAAAVSAASGLVGSTVVAPDPRPGRDDLALCGTLVRFDGAYGVLSASDPHLVVLVRDVANITEVTPFAR